MLYLVVYRWAKPFELQRQNPPYQDVIGEKTFLHFVQMTHYEIDDKTDLTVDGGGVLFVKIATLMGNLIRMSHHAVFRANFTHGSHIIQTWKTK